MIFVCKKLHSFFITGIYLKFVYLVKLLSDPEETVSPEFLENASSFEGWGLTLVTYKKVNFNSQLVTVYKKT